VRFLFWLVPSVVLLGTAATASAELRGKDRQQVTDTLYRPCYFRTHVPTNRWVEPFLEISPTAYGWDRLVGPLEEKARKKNKPSGVYFAFKPNDVVKWGRPSFDRDSITVWFQGIRDEIKVTFVQIETLDDFKKAFDRVFSSVPLQDEHPEWPAEVRSAIAAGKVIPGMTRQQAFSVVGAPLKVETATEAGAAVEIWHPRQDTADRRTPKTGLPVSIKFVGDKVATIT
jgi:hypothetical protein